MNKALVLLKNNKTVTERAEAFAKSIKRDIQKDMLDPLITKQEKIEDEIFELENFTLNTDRNANLKAMTKEDCQARFARLIQAKYELTLVALELKVKQEAYANYFTEEEAPKKGK